MTKTELQYIFAISLLFSLSFPPFPFGFLTPVALALLLHFLDDKSPKQCFRLGYWVGLIWGGFTLFWIAASTLPGAILVISINALHYALVAWLYGHFRRGGKMLALFSFPFVWVAIEYLRAFSDLRFNWLVLAHTQTYYLPLIQIAEYTGYLGISFILVILGILLYNIFSLGKFWKWLNAVAILIIVLALFIFGKNRINRIEAQQFSLLKAGLIQPNVDPYEKWEPSFQKEAFGMLMKSSRNMVKQKPDLIVWPETAVPFYLRARFTALQEIYRFLDSSRVYLLTGSPDYEYFEAEDDYHTYNAAFFFRPFEHSFESHYKITLVPGSETMPFKRQFPFLRKVNVGGGDFFPGTKYTVFKFKVEVKPGKFDGEKYVEILTAEPHKTNIGLSAIICYESVFPDLVRRFISGGANLLTIITNDGWFGETSGPYQHAQYAVLRAVENRVSIIRCANTGISGFISPTGKYLTRAGLNTRQNKIAEIPIVQRKTFYTRKGEWLGNFTLLMSLLFIFIKLFGYFVQMKSAGKKK